MRRRFGMPAKSAVLCVTSGRVRERGGGDDGVAELEPPDLTEANGLGDDVLAEGNRFSGGKETFEGGDVCRSDALESENLDPSNRRNVERLVRSQPVAERLPCRLDGVNDHVAVEQHHGRLIATRQRTILAHFALPRDGVWDVDSAACGDFFEEFHGVMIVADKLLGWLRKRNGHFDAARRQVGGDGHVQREAVIGRDLGLGGERGHGCTVAGMLQMATLCA